MHFGWEQKERPPSGRRQMESTDRQSRPVMRERRENDTNICAVAHVVDELDVTLNADEFTTAHAGTPIRVSQTFDEYDPERVYMALTSWTQPKVLDPPEFEDPNDAEIVYLALSNASKLPTTSIESCENVLPMALPLPAPMSPRTIERLASRHRDVKRPSEFAHGRHRVDRRPPITSREERERTNCSQCNQCETSELENGSTVHKIKSPPTLIEETCLSDDYSKFNARRSIHAIGEMCRSRFSTRAGMPNATEPTNPRQTIKRMPPLKHKRVPRLRSGPLATGVSVPSRNFALKTYVPTPKTSRATRINMMDTRPMLPRFFATRKVAKAFLRQQHSHPPVNEVIETIVCDTQRNVLRI
jgi:hypothetical protein